MGSVDRSPLLDRLKHLDVLDHHRIDLDVVPVENDHVDELAIWHFSLCHSTQFSADLR